jgi:SAM-dependent methyltransferase
MTDPKEVDYCFNHDYTPYTSLLAALSGLVLDIGGGNGIVRQFLPENVQYITIEPSLDWLESDWETFIPYFSCLETKPAFVRGIGEYLPFPAQSFDAVLSFWSLNHASQPERIFQEVHNVLKPNGEFLLVLEDMEPGLFDIDYRTSESKDSFPFWEVVTMKVQHLVTGQKWPLQSDHVRIQEVDIQKWISQRFKIRQRKWVGQYLTFKFQKI